MTTLDDHSIELQIEDLVASSPDIDSFAISVEVVNGTTRLSGLVGSFAERLGVLELAAGVVDPGRIRNDIQVRPYGADWKVSDARIAGDIRRDLESVLTLAESVQVEVDHHVVTLRGRVASGIERAEIRHVVESVSGVNIVHNQITV